MQEVYGVAAFRSRSQVFMFEGALRREGIPVKIVSTPRDVSMGCGLSVRFRLEDTAAVMRVLRQVNTTNLIGLYRVEYTGSGKPRLSVIPMY
ncbi:MAG: DUF3343 domain-containing protein [Candidatus Faecivicinus sp.]